MKRNILLSLSAAILLIFTAGASADTTTNNPGANGYNVFPLINSLIVNAGTSKTVTIYVQNISHAVEQVQTIVNDFVESPKNDGTPSLLLNGGHSSYSLKQFITIPGGNFSLNPGEQKSVNVTITIPANTSSGGYFAAVRFAPQSFADNKNVNLSGSVASLILVTVPGNLRENLTIYKLGASDSAGHIHSLFTNHNEIYGTVYFDNTGNVQLQPFGYFDIHQGKHDLGNNVVNKGNGYVLPGSQRYFTVKLKGVGSFGKYTIYGNFGFGSRGQLVTATASFYVIPMWILWTFLTLVVLLVIIIVTYLRLYHRNKSNN